MDRKLLRLALYVYITGLLIGVIVLVGSWAVQAELPAILRKASWFFVYFFGLPLLVGVLSLLTREK